MKFDRFSKFCWLLLIYCLIVILWGAFVRATGSGAGCGSHWPTCNGVLIPRSPDIETIIEFTHRLSSGLLGLLTLGLVLFAFQRFPSGHRVRWGSLGVTFFIVTEAAIGAGIVKFEWVADDDSIARLITVGFHLVNTYFLLACLTLTAWWASGGRATRLRGRTAGWMVAALVGSVLLAAGGGVTALGDTLIYDSGISPEDSPVVAGLVSARVYHPLTALVVGVLVIFSAFSVLSGVTTQVARKASQAVIALYGVQLLSGVVNVWLQAPVWMQLTHLFLAAAIWISFVLMSFAAQDGETLGSPA